MDIDTAIEFDDVVAGYGDFMILNRLGFKARRGRITLLLGPNGAGKSTTATWPAACSRRATRAWARRQTR